MIQLLLYLLYLVVVTSILTCLVHVSTLIQQVKTCHPSPRGPMLVKLNNFNKLQRTSSASILILAIPPTLFIYYYSYLRIHIYVHPNCTTM